MKVLNIQEAKTQLSRLVEEAAAGEEIVIAKAGKPRVRLTPYREGGARRVPGMWKGKLWIAGDFDRTDETIISLFEGAEKRSRGRRRRRTLAP